MTVLVEQRGAVLIVTLNRPEKRNAIDQEMMSGIGRAFVDAESDDSIAVIVLTGAGDRVFSAGLDLKAFAANGGVRGPGGPSINVVLNGDYPKPIIGAANGSAYAGGFELLLACDLVVAAPHATFALPEVKRGLVAAGGGVWRLPRRVPLTLALELGLTGEPIDAARAYNVGLINRIVPAAEVLHEATRLAETIASNAPLAVRFTKEQMRQVAGGDGADHFASFNALARRILASEDAREGALAFTERRPPSWTGH